MNLGEAVAVITSLSEEIQRLGPDAVRILLQQAGPCRREEFFTKLAEFCEIYHNAYENCNYVTALNGEDYVLNRIFRIIPPAPSPCIFDVGANQGDWSKRAHAACPSALIYCFEIAPPIFKQLIGNTCDIPNVIANECGLSDKPGQIAIRFFPDAPELTTAIECPHELRVEPLTGRVTTGDAFMAEHKIQQIDFAKIDVEGMEMKVLDGLSDAITGRRVTCIQFEYGRMHILTKTLLLDFYRCLAPRGYMIGKIYPNYVDFRNYNLIHEDFLGPNFLAIRNDRTDLIRALGAGEE